MGVVEVGVVSGEAEAVEAAAVAAPLARVPAESEAAPAREKLKAKVEPCRYPFAESRLPLPLLPSPPWASPCPLDYLLRWPVCLPLPVPSREPAAKGKPAALALAAVEAATALRRTSHHRASSCSAHQSMTAATTQWFLASH